MRLRNWEQTVERQMPLLLAMALLGGILIRVIWLQGANLDNLMRGEAWSVARAWAEGRGIADSFQSGQGPTAHIMPLVPIVSGTLFRWFGEQSFLTITLLTIWSLGTVFTGYYLYDRTFRLLRVPAWARLGAVATAAFIPLYMSLETVSFWAWEGGLAMMLGAACLYVMVRLDQAPAIGWGAVFGLSLLVAFTFFVSPALGLGAYFGGLVLMVRRFPVSHWLGVVACVAAAALIVLTPWTVRNAQVMGEPILLRSNMGLEMALANHPQAAVTDNPLKTFMGRYQALHPYAENQRGYQALQTAGGEVAYAKGLGDQAKAWIADNPLAFTRLAFSHLGQMLYPPQWLWDVFGRSDSSTPVRQLIHWGITTLGLLGLVVGYRHVGPRILYVAGFILLPLLPYLLVQPTLRYRYLIYHLLLWSGFAAIGWWTAHRRSTFR